MGHTKYVLNFKYVVIYKITSKDNDIKEVYIGSTTDFESRKRAHKTACTAGKRINQKIYKFIREHGVWSNFDMIQIDKIKCKKNDTTTARIREREWYDTLDLDSTLNSNVPFQYDTETRKEYDNEYNKTESRKQHNFQRYKKYRQEHKEESKIYYQLNKEKFKQRYEDRKNLII